MQFNHHCLCSFSLEKFSETEENRLEYTDLFQTYTNMVEEMLQRKLNEKIPVSITTLPKSHLMPFPYLVWMKIPSGV
jgi:hypothetical protein